MRQKGLWPKMLLIPLWDLVAFMIWVASFGRNTIRWRGYRLLHSRRNPGAGESGQDAAGGKKVGQVELSSGFKFCELSTAAIASGLRSV